MIKSIRMKNIDEEIRNLKIEITNIKRNLSLILSHIDPEFEEKLIYRILKQRGFSVIGKKEKKIILPRKREFVEDYLNHLKSYYMRRIISDIIKLKIVDKKGVKKLKERWGEEAVEKYLKLLVRFEIVELKEDAYVSRFPNIDNFGDTLEWFVSKILIREFAIPSVNGVKIKDIAGGGDFDIFFLLFGNLSYIETKSSPPNNVSIEEVENFIKRIDAIKPFVSSMFIDTTLNIERNIVDNMGFLLRRIGRSFNPVKLNTGFYRVSCGIYVFNAKRSIESSFHIMLKDLLKEERIEDSYNQ